MVAAPKPRALTEATQHIPIVALADTCSEQARLLDVPSRRQHDRVAMFAFSSTSSDWSYCTRRSLELNGYDPCDHEPIRNIRALESAARIWHRDRSFPRV